MHFEGATAEVLQNTDKTLHPEKVKKWTNPLADSTLCFGSRRQETILRKTSIPQGTN